MYRNRRDDFQKGLLGLGQSEVAAAGHAYESRLDSDFY